MKKINGIAVFVFTLHFVLGLSSESLIAGETADIYENTIEEQITKCNAKIRFVNSESNKLRQYCQVELRKAEFFSDAKEILLMEMIEQKIAAKEYKIQHFLNSRFYETITDWAETGIASGHPAVD
jgi:hypothetical protein